MTFHATSDHLTNGYQSHSAESVDGDHHSADKLRAILRWRKWSRIRLVGGQRFLIDSVPIIMEPSQIEFFIHVNGNSKRLT